MLADQVRQKDLFPRPCIGVRDCAPAAEESICSLGARSARSQALPWVNEGMLAPNQLAGRGHSPAANLRVPQTALNASLSMLERYAQLDPAADTCASDREALTGLLHTASVYSSEREDVAPYAKGLVSWPGDGSAPVELTAVLPPGPA